MPFRRRWRRPLLRRGRAQPSASPPAPPDAASGSEAPRTVGQQLRTWVAIGTQSVGGGSATLYLTRRLLVQRRRWVTDREFLEDWTLSRLSPGITLVALTALLGRRIGGRRGVAMAMIGMLGPAALITAVLTGAFGALESEPAVVAALAGMGPVTVGMMIGLTAILAGSAMRRGRGAVADVALVGAAVAIGFVSPTSPVVVILAGGIIGALFLGQGPPPDPPADT